MRIIVEGCDGTGKTSVCTLLQEKLNIQKLKLDRKDPRDFNFYKELLKKDNIIYDRHFISEIIYPEIFNRPAKLLNYESKYLFELAKYLNYKIVILTSDIDIIKDRLLKKFEEKVIINNVGKINNHYLMIAGRHNLQVIDTSNKLSEEVIKCIEFK